MSVVRATWNGHGRVTRWRYVRGGSLVVARPGDVVDVDTNHRWFSTGAFTPVDAQAEASAPELKHKPSKRAKP